MRRVTQARKLLRIPRLLTFLADVWFTDESWFTGDGISQKKNAYYWALTHDAVKPVRFQKHPTKVHVWATISVRGIIEPYFFHADGKNISVNQYTYQTCVKWFVSELKKRRRFKRAVFMQDGATPHTVLSKREYLRQTFHGRVIGKRFDKPWPPYTPLTSLRHIYICGLHSSPICIQGQTHKDQ